MAETTQQRQNYSTEDLLNSKEGEWKQNYVENDENKQGGEVEDLTLIKDSLEPTSNQQAEEIIESIGRERNVEFSKTQDGSVLGSSLTDSNMADEGFNPEIDTDFSPHQSEVASEVVRNPADLVYRMEKWRQVRDANLPKGVMSVALGNSPGMVSENFDGEFNIDEFLENDLDFDENNRRPKPRYLGFVNADGHSFFAMGAPASTQLNSGTPVRTGEEVDEYFSDLFGNKESLSILDITQGVSTLFDADPIVKDGKRVVEGGRDLIYDLFVAESDAVNRNGKNRWGEELDTSLPSNENYGRIESVLESVESVKDYQELVLDTPAKLGPEINSRYVEADFDVEGDNWFVVNHDEEDGTTLGDIVDDKGELSVRILHDGEMKDAVVNYDKMDRNDLEEHFSNFFDIQNTMFRPDIAPKSNGVVEVRNFSNSERANSGLVTQKAMLSNYDGVRSAFANNGIKPDLSGEQRHKWIVNGLESSLPDGRGMRDFYIEDLLPELVEGVRNSFDDNYLPYTLEKSIAAENIEDADELENHLAEFDGLEDFLDYQLSLDEEGVDVEYGSLSADEFSESFEMFREWFVDMYETEMLGYLEQPTVNEQMYRIIQDEGVEEAYEEFRRA